jgi:hypothetical protein
MTIFKQAQEHISTKDHVLVILFNQEANRGVWDNSLAFIRLPMKTQTIMLILDANKARDQKFFCFPKCREDLPFKEGTPAPTLSTNKKYCFMA